MEMSTQTSAEAARLLEALLVDSVQVYNVGEPVTTGPNVSRALQASENPVRALVQPLALPNVAEGREQVPYSVKVARDTPLVAGQAVKVLTCRENPALVGLIIFVEAVNMNRVRKGTGTIAKTINMQGKESLA